MPESTLPQERQHDKFTRALLSGWRFDIEASPSGELVTIDLYRRSAHFTTVYGKVEDGALTIMDHAVDAALAVEGE